MPFTIVRLKSIQNKSYDVLYNFAVHHFASLTASIIVQTLSEGSDVLEAAVLVADTRGTEAAGVVITPIYTGQIIVVFVNVDAMANSLARLVPAHCSADIALVLFCQRTRCIMCSEEEIWSKWIKVKNKNRLL